MYDSKDWWTSRTIWGGVAAIIGGLGLLFGIEVGANHVAAMTESLLQLATIIGGIITVWGRTVADKRIK
jgi:uncharacterized membrane protein